MSEPTTGLILIGHGSHLNADSSTPVYAHAERIREHGTFDQVLEAFWKEEPSLRDAIDLMETDRVVIVPLFLAEGYFTRELLPRELGLTHLPESQRAAIRYAPPVGSHPAMVDLILQRATSVADLSEADRRDAALVVIGHGTDRSDTSGDTVYDLVEKLRGRGEFGSVQCGFLDEDPRIDAVLDSVQAKRIILVPFFVAEGWHTRETIPEDLGLDGEVTEREGKTIWYTAPVGTLPEMADIVEQIAAEALVVDPPVGTLQSDVAAARADFVAGISTARWTSWMQLRIRATDYGFQVVHGTDQRVADFLLAHRATLIRAGARRPPVLGFFSAYAWPKVIESEIEVDAEQLRTGLLEIVRTNPAGDYRPLRSAPDLRAGWFADDLSEAELWLLLSVIYPASVLHSFREKLGTLEITPFRPWAARQTAMYRSVNDLSDNEIEVVIENLCKPCLRGRRWPIDEGAEPPVSASAVPCPEPCTVFATEARKLAADP